MHSLSHSHICTYTLWYLPWALPRGCLLRICNNLSGVIQGPQWRVWTLGSLWPSLATVSRGINRHRAGAQRIYTWWFQMFRVILPFCMLSGNLAHKTGLGCTCRHSSQLLPIKEEEGSVGALSMNARNDQALLLTTRIALPFLLCVLTCLPPPPNSGSSCEQTGYSRSGN